MKRKNSILFAYISAAISLCRGVIDCRSRSERPTRRRLLPEGRAFFAGRAVFSICLTKRKLSGLECSPTVTSTGGIIPSFLRPREVCSSAPRTMRPTSARCTGRESRIENNNPRTGVSQPNNKTRDLSDVELALRLSYRERRKAKRCIRWAAASVSRISSRS
jgi:hypothetical protein